MWGWARISDRTSARSASRCRQRAGGRLQPALALEIDVGADGGDPHQQKGQGVAPSPGKLGHIMEIHAEDAGDHRRRHEDYGGYGKDFDNLVLLDVNKTERRIQQEVDSFREKRVMGENGFDIFLDVIRIVEVILR